VRVIVEVRGRAFMLQFIHGKSAQDEPDEAEDEKFKHVPVDPHSVGGGLVERGAGADAYTSDVTSKRGFGFVCQDPGA
jgi:hypothetical protein